jgi:hypothetical protein
MAARSRYQSARDDFQTSRKRRLVLIAILITLRPVGHRFSGSLRCSAAALGVGLGIGLPKKIAS